MLKQDKRLRLYFCMNGMAIWDNVFLGINRWQKYSPELGQHPCRQERSGRRTRRWPAWGPRMSRPKD